VANPSLQALHIVIASEAKQSRPDGSPRRYAPRDDVPVLISTSCSIASLRETRTVMTRRLIGRKERSHV
jgi:hypothetical protein